MKALIVVLIAFAMIGCRTAADKRSDNQASLEDRATFGREVITDGSSSSTTITSIGYGLVTGDLSVEAADELVTRIADKVLGADGLLEIHTKAGHGVAHLIFEFEDRSRAEVGPTIKNVIREHAPDYPLRELSPAEIDREI